MLLICTINPKICSRFISVTMLVVKLDYLKTIFFLLKPIFYKFWKIKKIKYIQIVWLQRCLACQETLTLIHNLVEIFFKLLTEWQIEKLTILFTRVGFKLHDMVLDKKNSGPISLKPSPFVFGLLYKQCQTSDVLISVLYIGAKSKQKEMVLQTMIFFCIIWGDFRSWRASKLHQWFKSHVHFAEFDWIAG